MPATTEIKPISLRSQYYMFRDGWHLVHYHPPCMDAISQSVICYKQQHELIGARWNNLATTHITQLNFKPDYIVRALASREMLSSGTIREAIKQEIPRSDMYFFALAKSTGKY